MTEINDKTIAEWRVRHGYGCEGDGCEVCPLLDALERKQAALEKYGDHRAWCILGPGQPCTCGLKKELE